MNSKVIFFSRAIAALAFFPFTCLAQDTRQLLMVVSNDWNQTAAVAATFEGHNGSWTQVSEKQNAVVGKNGMGWGIGKHPTTNLPVGPIKKEGDLKAPAGIFDLTFNFGRLDADDIDNSKFEYLKLQENIECIDDGDSLFYNQVVDRTQVGQVDWSSSEKMFFEPLYLVGAFIGHNSLGTKAKGSCIFLHVRPPGGGGTAGCTAFAQQTMVAFAKWFDDKKKPVLVQLPRAAYETVKLSWGLPKEF